MFDIDFSYTLFIVAGGAALLGAISGIIGSLAMLKKNSLLADAVSHASLPGIVLAFMLTGSRTHSVLIIGAAIAGCFAASNMFLLVKKGHLKKDSSLSLMLSMYFGLGMVLLSYIQYKPNTAPAGIETFLFGQAATMLVSDIQVIAVIGGIILFLLIVFWKELLLVAFDSEYAAGTGLPVTKLELLFLFMLVGSVIIGLQTVGVVLMSALLVTPAAAARQWTNNIVVMMLLASFFGALSGVIGSVASSFIPNLPTGPAIIVCISLIALLSFFLAPCRGIIPNYLRRKNKLIYADAHAVLDTLYILAGQDGGEKGHERAHIRSMFPIKNDVDAMLAELKEKGLATEISPAHWSITPLGRSVAERSGHIIDMSGKALHD
ncbi:MAG: metal ABC transporter permease [Deferribacteraceae bacterium]|jgi:manganese/zinc/iron transport system permease protein|nr:metal ABC transporter permease [Deferribacteraceae bacterium]